MKDGKYIKWLIGITIILTIVPVIFYLYKFGDGTLSTDKGEWGTFGDFIGGVLNPLISLLTLAVTVYIAITFNDYEKRRDEQSKTEADVKSYLELYQYFVGPEFREKRQIGWNVVRRAVENPEYADFVVKENFVCRYTDRLTRTEVYNKFKDTYKETFPDKKSFLHKESEDRHKLDAVINFFQLLAVKDVPKDNHKVCDFYYDSWRPILCWYAKKLEEGYNKFPINLQYSNPPNLRATIALLDKKYYCPTTKDTLTVDTILEHPILKWYVAKQNDD
jgi:hypothetical protein